jgi:hypothetical protein
MIKSKGEKDLTNTAFFLALFTILIISIISYSSFRSNAENEKNIKKSYLIQQTFKEILSNLKDAEAGERGFIITGDAHYLRSYYYSIERNETLFRRLHSLFSDKAIQQARVAKIKEVATSKLALSNYSIDTRRSKGSDSPVAYASLGEGKKLMDQIRGIFEAMDRQEQEYLEEIESRARKSEAQIKAIVIVGTIISIPILLIIYFAFRRQLNQRKKNEKEIKKLNNALVQTVSKKTEELISKELQWKNTLDTMLEGAQIISFDWKFLYVNNTAITHNRYSKDELIGYTIKKKFPGRENFAFFRKLNVSMEKRIPQQFETTVTFPDYSARWFEISVSPVPEGIFILSIDITERKKAEKQKEDYTNALEEMMFINSHKVRHPVTMIMGISDLLDGGIGSPEELKTMTGYIKDSVNSLDKITRDLTLFINQLREKNVN